MHSTDPEGLPDRSSIDAAAAAAVVHPAPNVRPAWLWSLTLAAGVLAGIASWIGGEALQNVVKPRLREASSKGRNIKVASRHDQSIADAKNAGMAFALSGGLLSAGLGVAGGLARRSGRASARAGLLGLVLGTAAAAGSAAVVLPYYNTYKEQHPDEVAQDLVAPLLVHVVILSAIGAASGLTFGIGLGTRSRWLRCLSGALAGAAAGAIAHDLIRAAVFPLANTAPIVAESRLGRLLARLVVAFMAAAGAAVAAGEPRS
jgi:hypothetical protein